MFIMTCMRCIFIRVHIVWRSMWQKKRQWEIDAECYFKSKISGRSLQITGNVCQYAVLVHMLAQVYAEWKQESLCMWSQMRTFMTGMFRWSNWFPENRFHGRRSWLNPEITDFMILHRMTSDWIAMRRIRRLKYSDCCLSRERVCGVWEQSYVPIKLGIGYKNRLLVSIPSDMKFLEKQRQVSYRNGSKDTGKFPEWDAA